MIIITTPNIPLGYVGVYYKKVTDYIAVFPTGERCMLESITPADLHIIKERGWDPQECLLINEESGMSSDYHINCLPPCLEDSYHEADTEAHELLARMIGPDLLKSLDVGVVPAGRDWIVRLYYKTISVSVKKAHSIEDALLHALTDEDGLPYTLTASRNMINAALDKIRVG